MRIHHLFSDESGQSHFHDMEIELTEAWLSGFLSKPHRVSTMTFREIPPGTSIDWHNAPRRQYNVYLDGRVKTTASDGESRILGPGEIMLVEDTSGKGHKSETLGERPFRAIFVAIE